MVKTGISSKLAGSFQMSDMTPLCGSAHQSLGVRIPVANQRGFTYLLRSLAPPGWWGEGGCSGRLEVFHEAPGGRCVGDSWDAKDLQVVCRQLGCGSAGKAHSNATFETGKDDLWLTEVTCRALRCTCGTAHTSTAAAHTRTRLGSPAQPCLNGTTPSARKPSTRRSSTNWLEGEPTAPPGGGVALSEDPPSGYEDVEDSEGHSLSVLRFSHKFPEVSLLSGDLVMEDTPENYDDVIPADKHPDSVAGELVEGDAPEHYDDVITMQLGPDAFPGDHVTDTEENYDDVLTLDWIQVGESVLAETLPAPSGMDYDDVGEWPPGIGGAL
ncbi:hypothetical protein ANANG_G00027390 [Anguilla anguilla]|uniref:SRCR domain-containing protein n=1 Tax=Anguilla anguilla TaxID=7936 RepID=A0A9D3MVC3_ANGAN|nr:hypothetical protein ANANG_G00027390 [Anguilla anguilla]